MKLKALGVAAIMSAAIAAPAFAHHTLVAYEMELSIKVQGTVKELDWMNPHSWLHVMVKNPRTGQQEEWEFIMGSPVYSAKNGWKRDTLKPGDLVTFTMHPAKDGSKGGQLVTATLPDGRTLEATEPEPKSTNG